MQQKQPLIQSLVFFTPGTGRIVATLFVVAAIPAAAVVVVGETVTDDHCSTKDVCVERSSTDVDAQEFGVGYYTGEALFRTRRADRAVALLGARRAPPRP